MPGQTVYKLLNAPKELAAKAVDDVISWTITVINSGNLPLNYNGLLPSKRRTRVPS